MNKANKPQKLSKQCDDVITTSGSEMKDQASGSISFNKSLELDLNKDNHITFRTFSPRMKRLISQFLLNHGSEMIPRSKQVKRYQPTDTITQCSIISIYTSVMIIQTVDHLGVGSE